MSEGYSEKQKVEAKEKVLEYMDTLFEAEYGKIEINFNKNVGTVKIVPSPTIIVK